MLKEVFFELVSRYCKDAQLSGLLWEELAFHYQAANRHYHNLSHLAQMFGELDKLGPKIKNRDAVLFALFYHDVIYQPASGKNEIRSAAFAVEKMQRLQVPPGVIEGCKKMILLTKGHETSEDPDANFFTDADLSILGKPWEQYLEYARKVRKEYSFYPDLIYRPGRRKVLKHFLNMAAIFKTPEFYESYEQQARSNLEKELQLPVGV